MRASTVCTDAMLCLGFVRAVTDRFLHHADPSPFEVSLDDHGHCHLKADPAPLCMLPTPLLRAAATAYAIPVQSLGDRQVRKRVVQGLTCVCLKMCVYEKDGALVRKGSHVPLSRGAAVRLLKQLQPTSSKRPHPQKCLHQLFLSNVKALNLSSRPKLSKGLELCSLHQSILQVQTSIELPLTTGSTA